MACKRVFLHQIFDSESDFLNCNWNQNLLVNIENVNCCIGNTTIASQPTFTKHDSIQLDGALNSVKKPLSSFPIYNNFTMFTLHCMDVRKKLIRGNECYSYINRIIIHRHFRGSFIFPFTQHD